MRDSLFGDPLRPHAQYLRDRDWRLDRPPDRESGDPGIRSDIPRTIDSSRPYPQAHDDAAAERERRHHYLGGKQWTSQFSRYMRGVQPKALQDQRDAWEQWWRNPYVRGRIAEALGPEKLEVALAVVRDKRPFAEIAAQYQHSFAWIDRQVRQATRLVRTRYLPYADRVPLPLRPGDTADVYLLRDDGEA